MTFGLNQLRSLVVLVQRERSVGSSKILPFFIKNLFLFAPSLMELVKFFEDERLEERKNKRKKTRTEEHLEFPRHEQIKFGEVVDAPPKLVALPKMKALKTAQVASQERLRLQAVEAYRNRKGWTSRPGIQLPPPLTTSPSV
nr:probable H/ACA ribonucleoprotein complex subunit 4 [Ipomoea batatas]